MKWKGRRKSENVDDRRKLSGPKLAAGGGLGVILIAVLTMLQTGRLDPQALLELLGQAGPVAAGGESVPAREITAEEEEWAEFSKVVLADTEDVWNGLLGKSRYREPTLVLFHENVRSGCGVMSSDVGPFYCPADDTVNLDLGFFEELGSRYGAKGDFAAAYVIAHEVGHHVQNLLGTSTQVHREQQRVSKTEANELSVRLELQADFYAGVFAHHAGRMFDSLEPGDLEEALRAASAIGDDTLQRRSGGGIRPDLFTHGTSDQRQRWFERGYETGDPNAGNTFAVPASQL